MSVRKVSVSIVEEVLQAALESAQREGTGLSAWLTRAAQDRLRTEQTIDIGWQAARELIVEYQAKHGPVTPEVRDWTNAVLVDAGLEPEPLDHHDRAAG